MLIRKSSPCGDSGFFLSCCSSDPLPYVFSALLNKTFPSFLYCIYMKTSMQLMIMMFCFCLFVFIGGFSDELY